MSDETEVGVVSGRRGRWPRYELVGTHHFMSDGHPVGPSFRWCETRFLRRKDSAEVVGSKSVQRITMGPFRDCSFGLEMWSARSGGSAGEEQRP